MKANQFEKDTFNTSNGQLIITFIGHASLMFEYNGKIIHIDPVSEEADYSVMPKADLVLVTHDHGDHLDFNALKQIEKDSTVIIGTEKCNHMLEVIKLEVMYNGDKKELLGWTIQAVPAYNRIHKRSDGNPYHRKGDGNGYVINLKGFTIYIAGDTEDIPEMKSLKDINIAFLPMNLPYTMTPEMVANAARIIKPRILYPYHYGKTDCHQLIELMKDQPQTEVRIREMP